MLKHTSYFVCFYKVIVKFVIHKKCMLMYWIHTMYTDNYHSSIDHEFYFSWNEKLIGISHANVLFEREHLKIEYNVFSILVSMSWLKTNTPFLSRWINTEIIFWTTSSSWESHLSCQTGSSTLPHQWSMCRLFHSLSGLLWVSQNQN